MVFMNDVVTPPVTLAEARDDLRARAYQVVEAERELWVVGERSEEGTFDFDESELPETAHRIQSILRDFTVACGKYVGRPAIRVSSGPREPSGPQASASQRATTCAS